VLLGVVVATVDGVVLLGVSVIVVVCTVVVGFLPTEPPVTWPSVVPARPDTACPASASNPVMASMPTTKATTLVAAASVHLLFHHGRFGLATSGRRSRTVGASDGGIASTRWVGSSCRTGEFAVVRTSLVFSAASRVLRNDRR